MRRKISVGLVVCEERELANDDEAREKRGHWREEPQSVACEEQQDVDCREFEERWDLLEAAKRTERGTAQIESGPPELRGVRRGRRPGQARSQHCGRPS